MTNVVPLVPQQQKPGGHDHEDSDARGGHGPNFPPVSAPEPVESFRKEPMSLLLKDLDRLKMHIANRPMIPVKDVMFLRESELRLGSSTSVEALMMAVAAVFVSVVRVAGPDWFTSTSKDSEFRDCVLNVFESLAHATAMLATSGR